MEIKGRMLPKGFHNDTIMSDMQYGFLWIKSESAGIHDRHTSVNKSAIDLETIPKKNFDSKEGVCVPKPVTMEWRAWFK